MYAAVNIVPAKAALINVLSLDDQEVREQQYLSGIVSDFFAGVSDMRMLLKTIKAIMHCPVSQGKDSTIVELMAIEAYRQAIEAGDIAADHPLILSTVDTAGEAIPMKMYVRYARKRIIAYAKEHGVNLIYDIVTPPIYDEYFVRFAGAQKLIPNATRNGDCSVILKITPSERYVKRVLGNLSSTYSGSPVVSCVGSRLDESGRRSNNMKRQGIASKGIDSLFAEMGKESIGNVTIYKFAPIKNWSTDAVFDALRLAGSRPLLRRDGFQGIPAFLPDFGLLLEIYGNGSNETCEISVGSTASSGCNGKARFGCVFCTMVAVKDNSSTALATLPRWRALGAENTLRVRDYLFRLSIDMNARALHARAHDPVVFNRVALQPNTLKPKYLEKMVRFASQLTLDSRRAADEFAKLVANGREMEHSGYKDIAEDPFMPPKTKKAFLAMYKECAQDPECLNVLFSEKHAIVLSYRWAIDGIASAPYRPLAIWERLNQGRGWVPYPMLNTEYEARYGALKLSNNSSLPEAVMMPIYQTEVAKDYALNPIPLLSQWSRPSDSSDVNEVDRNCTLSASSAFEAPLEVTWQPVVERSVDGTLTFEPTLLSARLGGKVMPVATHELLLQNGLRERLTTSISVQVSQANHNWRHLNGAELTAAQAAWIENVNSIELRGRYELSHFSLETLFTGYGEQARKQQPAINFTRRVTRVVRNRFERGNTRMVFYSHQPDSRLHEAHKQESNFWVPEFSVLHTKFIATHNKKDEVMDFDDALQSLLVDDGALQLWHATGGLERAMFEHDKNIAIRRRRYRTIRDYSGTYPAEQLMAAGVVSVDTGYRQALFNVIRRTQLFDSLSLFQFQNSSVSEVLSHPRAVTMAQHRKDKVTVLKVIQQYRREQRRQVCLTNVETYLDKTLDIFLSVALQSISKLGYRDLLNSCRLRFHTGALSPATEARIGALWLAMNLSGLNDMSDVLSKLLSNQQLNALKADGAAYLRVSQRVAKKLSALAEHIDYVMGVCGPILQALTNWVPLEGQTKEQARQTLKDSILALVPERDVEDDMWVYYNASMSNMIAQVVDDGQRLNRHFSLLAEVNVGIKKLTKIATRKAVARMSLSDKLAMLA